MKIPPTIWYIYFPVSLYIYFPVSLCILIKCPKSSGRDYDEVYRYMPHVINLNGKQHSTTHKNNDGF